MSATTDVVSRNSSTSFWRLFGPKYIATIREPSTTEATIGELTAKIQRLETTQEERIKVLETSIQQAIGDLATRLETGLGETSSTAETAFKAFEARLIMLEAKIDALQREKNEEETRLAASNDSSSTASRANLRWNISRTFAARKNSMPASGADSSSMASS